MAGIYICYRRGESSYYATALDEIFSEYFGKQNVFHDVHSIEPGLDFAEVIREAVGSCNVLVALIGESWLDVRDAATGLRRLENPDDYVRIEIATALKRNVRVIPLLIGGASLPRADALPGDIAALTHRNAFEIDEYDFKRLTDGSSYYNRHENHQPFMPLLTAVEKEIIPATAEKIIGELIIERVDTGGRKWARRQRSHVPDPGVKLKIDELSGSVGPLRHRESIALKMKAGEYDVKAEYTRDSGLAASPVDAGGPNWWSDLFYWERTSSSPVLRVRVLGGKQVKLTCGLAQPRRLYLTKANNTT